MTFERKEDKIIIQLNVIPKSSRTAWGKIVGDRIQLKITAPPVDGAANQACIKFLSKEFKTSKSSIRIVRGETSRQKTIEIIHYSEDKLKQLETTIFQQS